MSKKEKQELYRLFIRVLKRSGLLHHCGFKNQNFFKYCNKWVFKDMEKLLYGEIDYLNIHDGIKVKFTDKLRTENRTVSISYSTLLFQQNNYEYIYEDIEIYDIKQYYLVVMYAFFITYFWSNQGRVPISFLKKKIIIDKIIKKYENKNLS
jgi:hypothetical protein